MILRVLNLILIVITFGLVEIIDTVTYDEIDNNITVTGYEDYTYREVFDGNNLISDGIFTGIIDITHNYYNASEDGTSLIDNTVRTAGKNLFDGVFENGGIDSVTGLDKVDVTRIRTDYIAIPLGNISIITEVNYVYYYLYDINYNYLGIGGNPSDYTHTFNNITASYLRMRTQVGETVPENVQIEQGIIATTYEEYKPLYLAFDLTTIFGTENEPTIEQFETMLTEYERMLTLQPYEQVTTTTNTLDMTDLIISLVSLLCWYGIIKVWKGVRKWIFLYGFMNFSIMNY